MTDADIVVRTPLYARLMQALKAGVNTHLLDGPISTELDARGATMASGRERRAALDEPETLTQIHVDYIEAGAAVATTHTFGLRPGNRGRDFGGLVVGAVECAMEARRRTGTEDRVVIAGSLAYHTPLGNGHWDPDMSPEAWLEEIAATAAALKRAGVDVLLLEMVGGPAFTAPLIQVVHELRMPFWIGFSAHDIGRGLVMFDNVATPIDKALARLVPQAVGGTRDEFADGDSGCDLMGAMHCRPSVLADVLDAIQAHGWSGPLMAYADDVRAWDPSSARVVAGDDPVEVYRDHCLGWRDRYPQLSLLGACCGFSVRHIESLAETFAIHP